MYRSHAITLRALLVAVCALASTAATPSPTPLTATGVASGLPDLPIAGGVPWLPVGESPIPARDWTPSAPLQAALQAAVDRHQGSISVVVTNLMSGATASVNADEQLSSASLYKLFLLHDAYAQMASGKLNAQDVLTLDRSVADADPYTDLRVGTRSSLSCALQTMVEISSNSAADLIEGRLGDEAVNGYLRDLGLQKSYITPDHAYTSAADIARLLNGIALGQAVSPLASSQMLTMLLAQQENNRLPLALPLGIAVAHKTGELPRLRHDAGIVYAPGGPYLFVALVANAPSEAAARDTIVDLSQTAYSFFGPGSPPTYAGLPPRLALEMLRVPDGKGRLPLLLDPRTDTVPLDQFGVAQRSGVAGVRLRQEVVPDLVELQRAASSAGVPFWVSAGFEVPTGANADLALPAAFVAPCAMQLPPSTASPSGAPGGTPSPTPAATSDVAPQSWLGTVMVVSDRPDSAASGPDAPENAAARWLADNAWQFGFVRALPESDAGNALGYEPWTWRWVGRPLAAELQPYTPSDAYGYRARMILRRATSSLVEQPRP
ncbi:MAG: serine hydrolase [Chloroflexi bacterium]|nr:serine hydrolase [Chloroflexota bacterium]